MRRTFALSCGTAILLVGGVLAQESDPTAFFRLGFGGGLPGEPSAPSQDYQSKAFPAILP
jgi:hypothetical protein